MDIISSKSVETSKLKIGNLELNADKEDLNIKLIKSKEIKSSYLNVDNRTWLNYLESNLINSEIIHINGQWKIISEDNNLAFKHFNTDTKQWITKHIISK